MYAFVTRLKTAAGSYNSSLTFISLTIDGVLFQMTPMHFLKELKKTMKNLKSGYPALLLLLLLPEYMLALSPFKLICLAPCIFMMQCLGTTLLSKGTNK